MHPITVYEIAVREHERALAERALDRQVRRALRERAADGSRPAPLTRRSGRTTVAPVVASDGRPAVA